MTRWNKSLAIIVLAGVATSSALVAYRSGLRRGLSEARPAPTGAGCLDIRQAATHAGEQACVTGRVLRAFTSKSGNTFLDFCEDYRSCPFTSVVFASARTKFGDLTALQGRQIELRGKIQVYRDQPEIVLNSPEQIREVP